MRKIYSHVNPEILLFVIFEYSKITSGRIDLTPEQEILQVSVSSHLPRGKKFRPHMHLPLDRHTHTTQEAWLVQKGSIKITLYDLDKSLLEQSTLYEGDILIYLRGGHTYEVLSEGTVIYEFKNGPYLGQQNDKVFLDVE